MSIQLLSQDPFNVILGFSHISDIIHLSETNTYLHHLVYESETIKNVFVSIYGAYVKADEPFPLNKLASRIKKILEANAESLKNIPVSEKTQRLDLLYHMLGIPSMQIISKETANCVEEFYKKIALDLVSQSPRNLPDIRNKCLRLQTIDNEILHLEHILVTKFPTLDFLSYRKYQGLWVVNLGETTVNIKGKNLSIDILAFPQCIDGFIKGGVTCSLIRKDTKSLLAEIHIKRLWRDPKEIEYSEETCAPKHLLDKENYKLQINSSFVELSLIHDPNTGDFPLQRLMLQIAVEIFMHDPSKVLIVKNCWNGWNSIVDAAGGFSYPSPYREEMLQQFKEARDEGKLFSLRSNSYYCASQTLLYKDFNHEFDTQFVKITKSHPMDASQTQPALVDFSLNLPPVTWEKIIERHPLINLQPHPILPEYWSSRKMQMQPSKRIAKLTSF